MSSSQGGSALNRQSLKRLGISALAICMLGSVGGPQSDEDSLGAALAPAVASTGGAARLYFATQCSADDDSSFRSGTPYPPFPQLTLAPSPTKAAPLEAVRAILRNQRDAVVTEDRLGMIRITLGVVPTALLNTKIARLAFDPLARWNPEPAISAIKNTSEVKDAMRTLNVQLPRLRLINIILTGPGDNHFPHLPVSLENVTMDQALDAVARTFRQLVIYGICTQPDGQSVLSLFNTPLTECASYFQVYSCFVPPGREHSPFPGPTKYPSDLSAAQSDAAVVQSFYDRVCAFAKTGDDPSEYTFWAQYLADSLTATMINGKPYGKSAALADLRSRVVANKPTFCFTEVRNVTRNGDQITAEVTLHGAHGDDASMGQLVDRYSVVFVNSPPWQLLKSTELEHWELDGNGKVLTHALLPGTTSQPPVGSHP